MTLTEKLDELLAEHKISRRQFAIQADIPYMTVVGFYEKGTDNIKLSTLKKIADFFGVSLDYIADDRIEESLSLDLPKTEKIELNETIKKYHQLNETGQAVADAYIDGLLLNPQYCKELPAVKSEVARTVQTEIVQEHKQPESQSLVDIVKAERAANGGKPKQKSRSGVYFSADGENYARIPSRHLNKRKETPYDPTAPIAVVARGGVDPLASEVQEILHKFEEIDFDELKAASDKDIESRLNKGKEDKKEE